MSSRVQLVCAGAALAIASICFVAFRSWLRSTPKEHPSIHTDGDLGELGSAVEIPAGADAAALPEVSEGLPSDRALLDDPEPDARVDGESMCIELWGDDAGRIREAFLEHGMPDPFSFTDIDLAQVRRGEQSFRSHLTLRIDEHFRQPPSWRNLPRFSDLFEDGSLDHWVEEALSSAQVGTGGEEIGQTVRDAVAEHISTLEASVSDRCSELERRVRDVMQIDAEAYLDSRALPYGSLFASPFGSFGQNDEYWRESPIDGVRYPHVSVIVPPEPTSSWSGVYTLWLGADQVSANLYLALRDEKVRASDELHDLVSNL